MKEPKGYKEATPYSDQERLPAGGYPITIKAAKVESMEWGEVLIIQFDIFEGEHKDFFKENYLSQTQEDRKWKGNLRVNLPKEDGSEQDNWALRSLKTNMLALEDSNSGYRWNWDENSLKGLVCGALFRDKEYEYNGKTGFFTECFKLMDIEKVRTGNFKTPEPKTLSIRPDASSEYGPVRDEDIPFL
jgi:hypothetical protein